jgi:hypothetical protein
MRHTEKQLAFSRLCDAEGIWQCPSCGAGPPYGGHNGLYIDESCCEDADCDLVHAGDSAVCDECGWEGTVRQVVKASTRRLEMTQCPHCAGTGWVTKAEVDCAR